MNQDQQTIYIQVEGRVQGVYFRKATCEKAIALQLSGWVRNLPDGTVAIEATGHPAKLAELEAWCHTGPARAVVARVSCQQRPLQPATGFRIIR